MAILGLKINNLDRSASGGRTFLRMNPISGLVATEAAAASVADACQAVNNAARAFDGWAATGPGLRRKILFATADRLEERTAEFVRVMASETGATADWARHNIRLASDMLREAGALTTQVTGEIIPSNRVGSLAMAMRQAAGVVLSIAPWNAPVILGVRSLAMPLACGNTVVMKTSEICPHTHRIIVDTFHEAGLPEGVLNAVSNAPEDAAAIVEAMIAHPAVRRVNFTGSTRIGRIIGEMAGRHLKPALLELGGKSPFVVLDDADVDDAVAAAAFGAFINQGQICLSTERIVAVDTIADRFVDALGAKTRTLIASDQHLESTSLSCVVDAAAAQRIEHLIRDAVGKGAVLVAGGAVRGTIVEATVLDRVTPAMRIYGEESFGPVVAVVRVGSVDEAVRVANDTEYGLSAAVFGKDVNRAMTVARRIESGICHINGSTVYDEAQMPLGGMKSSGYGRFGGRASIHEFTELRWITVQDGPVDYPI